VDGFVSETATPGARHRGADHDHTGPDSVGGVITLDDVLAAREAIGHRVHRTPTFSSAALAERAGVRAAYLKAELFQRTGSFKPRGVLAKLASLSGDEKERGVVTWSAGNAAQAVAYAAAAEGISCRVFMWRGASELKAAATRGYGAQVDLEAGNAAAAHERLLAYVEETGATFVHPFDDPALHAGHGSLGLELLEDAPEFDLVVVPVGGGGLISGVATAIKGRRPDARVVGVEPEGSAALSAALAVGEVVPIQPQTIADGLGAPFTGEHSLAVCRERVDEVVLVTDDEIAGAMRFLYQRAKLACEPAGAAATAALLARKVAVDPDETAAAIVSGGNVDLQKAAAILAGQ
jgi:threonine dehydratase